MLRKYLHDNSTAPFPLGVIDRRVDARPNPHDGIGGLLIDRLAGFDRIISRAGSAVLCCCTNTKPDLSYHDISCRLISQPKLCLCRDEDFILFLVPFLIPSI